MNIFLRMACEEDCDLLFKWANDKKVRENSFTNDEIKYDDHVKWFDDKLNSERSKIFIFYFNNKPVGQVRIDKTKWYTINYELLQKLFEGKENSSVNIEDSDKNDKCTDGNNVSIYTNEQSTVKNEQTSCLEETEEHTAFNKAIPEITTKTTTKDNDDSATSLESIVDFYSQNIRFPGSYELERIKHLYEEFKNPQLIIIAMRQAIERNIRNLRYVETVLYNWFDNGIRTEEEAKRQIEEYKKYKGDRGNGEHTGKCWKNRCNNSKNKEKDNGKWTGYKPREPRGAADADMEGII